MKAPILSICIPTFNRLPYLRELLPIILAEVAEANRVEPRVELLISDNASADGTEAYLRTQVYPWLFYRRNTTNIGARYNFLSCIQLAQGDYVWLFGDDDLFVPGGMACVLDFLEQYQPGLLILSGDQQEEDIPERIIFSGYAACLRSRGVRFALAHTLISCNVFRREAFNFSRAESMQYTEYGHMYGMVDGLLPDARVAVLSGVMRTREVRAQFDQWPVALCVKQGLYLWHLAKRFGVSELRAPAIRLAMNLPVEIAAQCLRRISPRFGRT